MNTGSAVVEPPKPNITRKEMIKNYITVAIRHLWRLKGYTFINVAGLAVGIAACAFMLLFIRHELSYDRFHEDADRIYRIATEIERDGRIEGGAYVHTPIVARLGEVPEIEAVTDIRGTGRSLIKQDGEMFYINSIASADEHVFDLFDFELLRGDEETALVEPFSLVVTEELGRRLFGSDDPMGRSITLGDNDLTVTGILAPVPSASHWQFEGLRSMATDREVFGAAMYDRLMESWFSNKIIYVRLPKGVEPSVVETKLNAIMADARPDNTDPAYRLFLQPLTSIHLHSNLSGELGPPGDVTTLYVFGSIAALILIIACINYMNLATARSVRRAREIGVRKVVGARRSQLVGQLLGESVLTSLISAGLALILLELSLPTLGELVGRTLQVDLIAEPVILAGVFGLALLVGVLSGSYPAFFLSSAGPIGALRNKPMALRHGGLRKGLVVTQFAVSIGFIAGTGIILDQLDYIQNKDIGFTRDQIITIEQGDVRTFNAQYPTIKQELMRIAGVESVTASMGQPGIYAPDNAFDPDADGEMESLEYDWLATDFDFLETFDIELVAGRDLDPDRSTDSTAAILINETAARALALEDPIGHELQLELNNHTGTIVGVVRDFHVGSLREPIRPTLLYATPFYFYSSVHVKVTGGDIPTTLAALEETWKSFFPDEPMEYTFYDDAFEAQYEEERRTAKTAGIVSLLAVFVACLGLFGLASFAAEQRTKEIGVRKVLGATTRSVVTLLSKDFLKLVVIAFIVAAPLTWIAMSRWLDGFAYHVDPGIGTFAAAAAIAVGIALVTVSGQAMRAALSDPVKALRTE